MRNNSRVVGHVTTGMKYEQIKSESNFSDLFLNLMSRHTKTLYNYYIIIELSAESTSNKIKIYIWHFPIRTTTETNDIYLRQ